MRRVRLLFSIVSRLLCLGNEPCFANAGLPQEERDLALPVVGQLAQPVKRCQLAGAADENGADNQFFYGAGQKFLLLATAPGENVLVHNGQQD